MLCRAWSGVRYSLNEGVAVSDTLLTSNKSIYAVGDCCTKFQFTHVSDFMARLVIRNALFFGNGKFRY
jgi:pyruvate/2-oxoglutarate dehydrogenase complex dihydrolipoamide dehydrogenase (E3) component